jgi:hypothetical protein
MGVQREMPRDEMREVFLLSNIVNFVFAYFGTFSLFCLEYFWIFLMQHFDFWNF